jgi:hypothetical protein
MAGTEFKVQSSHPLTLLRSYIQTFGSEALEWEPFVVKTALERRLPFSLPRINYLKLLAAISVANHDQFWSSWETFHAVSQALAGKIPSVSHIDNQSVSDLMIAVDAANRIRADLSSLGDVPPFSEEVMRYMAAQLHESGIWYVPEPLEFLNPLISGVTQVCGECGNHEQPKEDGLCSYCTDRYNTDSLLKMEPDDELKKKFNGSKVKVTVKFPTAGVQKALVRALSQGGQVLRETEDDICAARVLEGIRDLHQYTAELTTQVKTAGLSAVAPAQKAVAAHNALNPEGQIEFRPPSEEKKPRQPKEPGISKYVNPVTLGGTALLAGGLARSPNAGKFLRAAKEVFTKPVTSIGRSMRAGANYVGPGADEFARQAAQSKRVEMMGESLRGVQRDLSGGRGNTRVTAFKALEGGPTGATTVDKLRKSGLLSAGEQSYENVMVGRGLSKKVDSLAREMDAAAAAGREVDYAKIEKTYNELVRAAQNQRAVARKGIGYYLPGERAIEVGAPVLTGVTEAATAEDPDTGRQRSLAERLARGAAAGGITAATGALFAGRNLGLSKKNLITGADRSTFSAKGLVPVAAGMTIGSTLETAGADLLGGGARLVDSAFGQKKEQT